MISIKAGCFLVNPKTKCIALVYRAKQKDFTFPKGHAEKGESIIEVALRETAEETKRQAKIVDVFEPFVEKYTSSSGEECECYMFFAVDNGPSDNDCTDTHDVHWIPFDDVEKTLSYPNLKATWNAVKDRIALLLT